MRYFIFLYVLILSNCLFGACPQFLSGEQTGIVESSSINEASGIAASRQNPNVYWVHNDSGDSARIFAMNAQGDHLGVYSLNSAVAVDWEDIAIGPGPDNNIDYLYCGDIGDNSAVRSYITVYRAVEPAVDANQSPITEILYNVEPIHLQYPDGARDAETLMIDPNTRDLYVISKRETPSKVYRAPYPQSTVQINTMELVAMLPWGWATAGEISPSGNAVIVRGYSNASLWQIDYGMQPFEAFAGTECTLSLIGEPQGEAICFHRNGCGYLTVSEGLYQPIYYFPRTIEPSANFDGDCDVDMNDYAFMAGEYSDQPVDSEADLDGNGYVDLDDLETLANEWLQGIEY